jgi:hypothetical protein
LKWTLLFALLGALCVWICTGWRNAAMFAAGGVISAASIHEWRRLMRVFTERFSANQEGRHSVGGAGLAVIVSLFRLFFFAAVIYGSLKWIEGSVFALLPGLALAVATLAWQALRLVRG